MSQIYNLTSDVTVTSFQMGSTPNLDISARYSEMCAQGFTSILSRCDVIDADVKGGNFMPPTHPAAGGWRGGPAADGLSFYCCLWLDN